MHNYPDDSLNHTCCGCDNPLPNCMCKEKSQQEMYNTVLNDDDNDEYFNMFDSSDSDNVVALLRKLHQNPSKENTNLLVSELDLMLKAYVDSTD